MNFITKISIDIEPITKDNFKTIGNHIYLPDKYKEWESDAGYIIRQQYRKPYIPIDIQLCVHIWFYFKINRRRDIGNYQKSICDACNKVLWDDDSQIKELHLYHGGIDKINPRIIMEVYEL